MGLTGLFLISFLIVHATINAMIFFNDGGVTFNHWAHFMGTNLIIRTMEIGLFAGFILHIIDGTLLWMQNNNARPNKYVYNGSSANSTWYSRSMMLLGTLLLLFLIIHIGHFWVKSRITGLEEYGKDAEGLENLYAVMQLIFAQLWVVIVYVLGCVALFWHLLHGFQSAFQTLGLNHKKYNGIINGAGIAFSIIVPLLFAAMPVAMHFKLID